VNVDIDVEFSPLVQNVDVEKLIDAAVDKGLQAAERTLREFAGVNSKSNKND